MNLILARGVKQHIRDLYVSGRRVIAHGKVAGVDLPLMEKELRSRFNASADIKAVMPELKRAFATHYSGRYYCG